MSPEEYSYLYNNLASIADAQESGDRYSNRDANARDDPPGVDSPRGRTLEREGTERRVVARTPSLTTSPASASPYMPPTPRAVGIDPEALILDDDTLDLTATLGQLSPRYDTSPIISGDNGHDGDVELCSPISLVSPRSGPPVCLSARRRQIGPQPVPPPTPCSSGLPAGRGLDWSTCTRCGSKTVPHRTRPGGTCEPCNRAVVAEEVLEEWESFRRGTQDIDANGDSGGDSNGGNNSDTKDSKDKDIGDTGDDDAFSDTGSNSTETSCETARAPTPRLPQDVTTSPPSPRPLSPYDLDAHIQSLRLPFVGTVQFPTWSSDTECQDINDSRDQSCHLSSNNPSENTIESHGYFRVSCVHNWSSPDSPGPCADCGSALTPPFSSVSNRPSEFPALSGDTFNPNPSCISDSSSDSDYAHDTDTHIDFSPYPDPAHCFPSDTDDFLGCTPDSNYNFHPDFDFVGTDPAANRRYALGGRLVREGYCPTCGRDKLLWPYRAVGWRCQACVRDWAVRWLQWARAQRGRAQHLAAEGRARSGTPASVTSVPPSETQMPSASRTPPRSPSTSCSAPSGPPPSPPSENFPAELVRELEEAMQWPFSTRGRQRWRVVDG